MQHYALCNKSIPKKARIILSELGIKIIDVPGCHLLDLPVSFHADMLCHKINDKLWIFEETTYKNLKLPPHDFEVITDRFTHIKPIKYPYDIRFNAAHIGDYLFCYERFTSPAILENTNAKIVDVRQGYAKCSMCIVNDYSFITSDRNLKKEGEKCGFDVLLIDEGHISINGYDYGFIGGTSGLFGSKLLFFGNLELHPNYEKIHNFLLKRNVEEVILSRHKLYDYGGILFT